MLYQSLSFCDRANHIAQHGASGGTDRGGWLHTKEERLSRGVTTVEWTWRLMNRDCGYFLVALGTAADCTRKKLMWQKIPLPTHGA